MMPFQGSEPEGMKAATPQGHALGSLDPGEGSQTPQSAMSLNEELLKLRQQVKEQEKEIRRLKKENDFPEEAGAFFAASRLRSAKTKECRLLRPKSYVFFRKTPKTILTGLSVPKVIQSPRNEKKPGKSGVSGQEIIPMEISIGTLEQGYKDSNLEVTESESVALPFGDSPSYSTNVIIRYIEKKSKYFFYFFKKISGRLSDGLICLFRISYEFLS